MLLQAPKDGPSDFGPGRLRLCGRLDFERPGINSPDGRCIPLPSRRATLAHQPHQFTLQRTGNPMAVASGKAVQHKFLNMDLDQVTRLPSVCGLLRYLHEPFSMSWLDVALTFRSARRSLAKNAGVTQHTDLKIGATMFVDLPTVSGQAPGATTPCAGAARFGKRQLAAALPPASSLAGKCAPG